MRPAFASITGLIAAGVITAGLVSPHAPVDSAFNVVGRPIEAIAPHLLVVGLVLAFVIGVLGRAVSATTLALAALCGFAWLGQAYWRQTLPLVDGRRDLSVLFLNTSSSNTENANRIVSAAIAVNPDVVVLAEARAILPAIERLRQAYTYVSPCDWNRCELLFATNLPVRGLLTAPLDVWTIRFGRLEIESGDGQRLMIAASHSSKPWDTVLVRPALAQIQAQYGFVEGPIVAVGDFNAPPWSRTVRELTRVTGVRGLRFQPGTWPVSAGHLGLPIDQVFVGNGVRVTGFTTFGDDLGSNHRGFVAEIALP